MHFSSWTVEPFKKKNCESLEKHLVRGCCRPSYKAVSIAADKHFSQAKIYSEKRLMFDSEKMVSWSQ